MNPAALHFDPYQFAGRESCPVSAATGISWQDFGAMQVQERRLFANRRRSAPAWAVSDSLLQEVIVAYLETRAQIGTGTGTLAERLARARESMSNQLPQLNATLDKLCHEYVTVKDSARKQELQTQIESWDTQVRVAKNPALLAAVVYFYYRVGLNSVGVAEELGLKPPHVRMLVYRMGEIAEELKKGIKVQSQPRRRRVVLGPKFVRFDTVVAAHLRKHGWVWRDIAEFLSIRSEGNLIRDVQAAGLFVRMRPARSYARRPRRHMHANGVVASFMHERGMDWKYIGGLLGLSPSHARRRAEHADKSLRANLSERKK
jgi:hypothetical protein